MLRRNPKEILIRALFASRIFISSLSASASDANGKGIANQIFMELCCMSSEFSSSLYHPVINNADFHNVF
jgi:hypothetical protein